MTPFDINMFVRTCAKLGTAAVVLAAMAAASHAATYYVASDGSANNDGSYTKPWPSVAVALDKVGGGNTIVLKPGDYLGRITVPAQAAGTKEKPTIIKSEKKWQAVISGGGLQSHGLGTHVDCSWVVFDGFQVMGASNGISLNGKNNTVRNCWVHHNWAMGISGTSGSVVDSTLIEFNGSHLHSHHGAYISGDGIVVQNNIVRHNSAYGLHLYPTLKNSVVANNLVYGQHYEGGIIVTCPRDGKGGNNLIVNNTVVDNARGIEIAHGNGEKVYNNIVVGKNVSFAPSEDTVNTLADYNLCQPASPLQGPHGLSVDPGFVKPYVMHFWLKADSPARGKGTAQYAPKTDFWGRTRPADKAPDLGAFSYSPYWASDKPWHPQNYWPYSYAPQIQMGLPDLWFVPKDEQ